MLEAALLSLTKKLLVSPPKLTSTDLHDALLVILDLLRKCDMNDDESLSIYTKVSSFLTALRVTQLDHKAEYIAEAAKAVLKHSDLVDLPSPAKSESHPEKGPITLDIVGTGGDGQNTFNVSTSAAIVASGIPGLKICKHGGKASTSNSGAGDLIRTLGCDISKVNSSTVPGLWPDNTFLFLLAPLFHHGMSHVSKIRKLLGIPTIFNVLGPLLHPISHVNKRILGVYSKELAPEYAKAAALVYPESETFIVWGHVGLDEVSPIGKTTVWHIDPLSSAHSNDQLKTFQLEPSMFGLKEHELSECASYGPKENARILREEILSGKYHLGDNNAIYDYILMNTAVLYCLSQGHQNWKEGIIKAEESIQSGNALHSLEHFITSVNSL
ncbi:Trp4p [Saccharomyces cerevisiae x Saccharomyces kudriavzevii VIN7]|uniref:Anthranilate phosphoribosyltransferase n=1 Tax=Saccharomyces cerevisiae x Saccharomyces kudriavzevii (strain VIN7) TaxID=1095631 RepID=H0GT79_SACCK|nr:Trp4p [Saccharomyces cerevisiae x Saccharomyces kudriavzevii VIN7]